MNVTRHGPFISTFLFCAARAPSSFTHPCPHRYTFNPPVTKKHFSLSTYPYLFLSTIPAYLCRRCPLSLLLPVSNIILFVSVPKLHSNTTKTTLLPQLPRALILLAPARRNPPGHATAGARTEMPPSFPEEFLMPTTNLFNRYIVRDSPTSRATSSHLHSLSSPTPLVYLLGYSSLHSLRVLVFSSNGSLRRFQLRLPLCLPIDFSPHTYYSLA